MDISLTPMDTHALRSVLTAYLQASGSFLAKTTADLNIAILRKTENPNILIIRCTGGKVREIAEHLTQKGIILIQRGIPEFLISCEDTIALLNLRILYEFLKNWSKARPKVRPGLALSDELIQFIYHEPGLLATKQIAQQPGKQSKVRLPGIDNNPSGSSNKDSRGRGPSEMTLLFRELGIAGNRSLLIQRIPRKVFPGEYYYAFFHDSADFEKALRVLQACDRVIVDTPTKRHINTPSSLYVGFKNAQPPTLNQIAQKLIEPDPATTTANKPTTSPAEPELDHGHYEVEAKITLILRVSVPTGHDPRIAIELAVDELKLPPNVWRSTELIT